MQNKSRFVISITYILISIVKILCSFHSSKATSNTEEQPDAVIDELLDIRTQFHDKARNNIQRAQQRQKEYYDSRHDSNHVS